jgi:hypothetical protein
MRAAAKGEGQLEMTTPTILTIPIETQIIRANPALKAEALAIAEELHAMIAAMRPIPGLALGKWRALLKERGAFHGQAAATVREGICGRSRSVG